MSLRYALLGFLTTEPATGYRLAQEFGESVGWFWQASHSQIYPELKRLETRGLVRGERTADDGRGSIVYSITASGRQALEEWLQSDTDYPPVRDAERVRLVFLDEQTPDVIRKHLEHHRAHHDQMLAVYAQQLRQIEEGTFVRLRKRLAGHPVERHELVRGLKLLALRGNVERSRLEIAWAEDALRWLDSVEPSVDVRGAR